MLPNILSYFRACYQSDFRTVHLLDFFSTKVGEPFLLDRAELLEDKRQAFPIANDWGTAVEKQLTIYAKEKALCCCAFMVTGATQVLGRKKKICAPLYIYPLQLVKENDFYYLQIDADNPTINPAIISFFQDTESGLYDSLCEALPKGSIGFDALRQIEEALKNHLPLLQLDYLADFPLLQNKKQLKARQKKAIAAHHFSLNSAVGVGLIDKPSGSRGILNELESMAQAEDYAQPLLNLWNAHEEAPLPSPIQQLAIPLALSEAQNKILKSALQHPLSLVIGPPGTGKSFTIAALALEYMSRGKSVLIAAKNIQAVNVVSHKIEKDFGLKKIVVKASSKDYKRDLKKRISNLLSGIGVEPVVYKTIKELGNQAADYTKKIEALEAELQEREKLEINRGGFLFLEKAYFWNRWKKKWLSKRVAKQQAYWDLMSALEGEWALRNKVLQRWLSKSFHYYLHEALCHYRQELQALLKGLKARTGNDKERYFQNVDFDKILEALSIWITDTSNIHQVLPLEKELFDLVIIDEASQSDIASALPLLQRAKQAVVVGDPKQLRHLSFLSTKQQNALIEQYGLGHLSGEQVDYRAHSLLDLVSENLQSQQQIHFLDEHYRSMPDIIQFSNREFYQDRMHLMTACPATLHKQHLFLLPQSGQRLANGSNPIEANALLDQIDQLMIEEAHLSPALCQSIGIISPFRNQVNYLLQQVQERFSTNQLQRHDLLVGTPYAFQGEERDLIFLSFALDDAAHPSAFRYLEREDVFNVSITRARSAQYIFTSFGSPKVKTDSLLAKYLAHIQAIPDAVHDPNPSTYNDGFMQEVIACIEQKKVDKIFTAYSIAGVEIDLVVIHQGQTYCIDLVGYPGAFEEALPIARWQMLGRIGLRTFTLPYSWWVFERAQSEKALLTFIG